MTTAKRVQGDLARLADGDMAVQLGRFFKTGPGEYGEGDRFRGIRVPALRRLAGRYRRLPLTEAEMLLQSAFHEDRLTALFILVRRYAESPAGDRQRIFDCYLANTRRINSWDLVDASAEHILGAHLETSDTGLLLRLAGSSSLWERRMAVMATFHYVKQGHFDETFNIVGLLLDDTEDLVQKAAGWMLREIGRRNCARQAAFLRRHYRKMPRTMLRSAIEKLPEPLRRAYLTGTV